MRNGPYTIYNNYHLAIRTIKDDDENVLLRFEGEECPFSNFIKSSYESNVYYLVLPLSSLKQAYWVKTFGVYKGFTIQVFPLNIAAKDMVTVATADTLAYLKLDLLKVHDNWFAKDIHKVELKSTWEERTEAFSLPIPAGVAKLEYVKL